MLGEQLLAGIGFEVGEALAGIRQHEIAFAQLGKPQQLKRFTEVKYLVGFELQVCRREQANRRARYTAAPRASRSGPESTLDETWLRIMPTPVP